MKLSRLPREVAPHECDWSTVVGWVGQHRQEQRCQAKLTHQGSFTQELGRISVAHLSLLEHSLSMHNSTNQALPRLMNRTRRATVWSTPGQVRGRTVSLVFLLSWWDSFALGEFGAGTVAVASCVSERVYWAWRRPSSSLCDRIHCVLGDDSPLGFAVIFFPAGEGWAVGCFPEQFLRKTDLIVGGSAHSLSRVISWLLRGETGASCVARKSPRGATKRVIRWIQGDTQANG